MDLLEELGVETEPCENSKTNAPKNIPKPYERPMLDVITERQDKFGKSCDSGYKTIEEQEEDD